MSSLRFACEGSLGSGQDIPYLRARQQGIAGDTPPISHSDSSVRNPGLREGQAE